MEKEQRNIIAAIALSALVLIGFNYFYKSAKPTPTEPKPITHIVKPQIETVSMTREEALNLSKRAFFETKNYKGSIDLKKGTIDDLSLKTYKETVDPKSPEVKLLTPVESANGQMIELAPQDIDTSHNLPMAFELVSASDQRIVLKSQSESYSIERVYLFKEDYCIQVEDRVTNNANILKKIRGYSGIVKLGTPTTMNMRILHEGVVGVINDKLEEINYKKLDKKHVIVKNTPDGWLGFTDKYFMTSVLMRTKATVVSEKLENGYAIRSFSDSKIVEPGKTVSFFYDVFSGPKELKLLESVEATGIKKFHMAVDFGWFYFLTQPLFKFLAWLNNIFHSFALALIIATVLIKIALFPMALKAYRSMKGMRTIQIKVDQLKEKYANDKLRQQQEIMQLYQKEKVQPTAGCLPILIQIPILYALYKVLYVTIEMRHAPFWGWVKDLSMPDTLYFANGFGLLNFDVPAMLQIGVWPVIMGITMYIQQKMTPTSDPSQEKVMVLLPFMFTFLFAGFPVGMVIYWTLGNVLSIIQQWLIVRFSNE